MANAGLVLDTNVVISAHLKETGFEHFVLDLALNSIVRLYVTEEIIEEYARVLERPKFRISPRKRNESLRLIRKAATLIEPAGPVHGATDPDDDKFLECAEYAPADYLVTGNKRHFPARWKSTQIVNARELITILLAHPGYELNR
jgi:uncharacterized protein